VTGTERKRAWRLRQSGAVATKQNVNEPRVDLLQAQADVLKTLRTDVRLKHSLAADNELRHLIPAAGKYCAGLIHRGHVPDLETAKRLLTGGKYPTR